MTTALEKQQCQNLPRRIMQHQCRLYLHERCEQLDNRGTNFFVPLCQANPVRISIFAQIPPSTST
eukprot:scaffold816_cov43-Cyclotella_meneghiniana.AAC.7